MTEVGEPLLQKASEAICRYRNAKSRGCSPEEIERLRWLAESLYQVVTDYQLREQGAVMPTLH